MRKDSIQLNAYIKDITKKEGVSTAIAFYVLSSKAFLYKFDHKTYQRLLESGFNFEIA